MSACCSTCNNEFKNFSTKSSSDHLIVLLNSNKLQWMDILFKKKTIRGVSNQFIIIIILKYLQYIILNKTSWTRGVWGESWCDSGICVVAVGFCDRVWHGYKKCEKWFNEWDVVCRWLGSDEWNNGGTEGEVLEIEGGIREQEAEGEPREDKSGSKWNRRWSVFK